MTQELFEQTAGDIILKKDVGDFGAPANEENYAKKPGNAGPKLGGGS